MATPGDLEAAYADALRGDRGGVHLLRLIQKTGPVWAQLSSHTCQTLLEVFTKHVRVSECTVHTHIHSIPTHTHNEHLAALSSL